MIEIARGLDNYKQEVVELHTWCKLSISSKMIMEQAVEYSEQLVKDDFFRIEEYFILSLMQIAVYIMI